MKKKTQKKLDKLGVEAGIFNVPFALEQINETIVVSTNIYSQLSNKQIINKAINFHLEGNIKEAVKLYQYCLDQGFNDHRVFSNYGAILKDIGNLKKAELSQRKAIELKPNLAIAHFNLGNTLKDLGKLEEAELSFRKAIELKPYSADFHYNLGNHLRTLGKLKESEISISKAIKFKPEFALAYYNLGITYIVQGKYKQASDYFRKALSFEPDMNHIRYDLGVALENEAKSQYHQGFKKKGIKLENEAKSQYLQAFKKSGVNSKLGLENRKMISFTKKKIIIEKNLIILLNNLSKSINELYGSTPSGGHAINSGPCGVFANEFFMLWNSRFINKVEIGFKMDLCPYQCNHVFIKLPNNQLFDGGKGVHDFNIYKGKNTELIFMEEYDLKVLDKYSWGLIRNYGKTCPNFSISKTSKIIAKHLDEIYYALS